MKIKNLVKTLRANNIKTKVSHYRFVIEKAGDLPTLARITKDNKKSFLHILAKGGETSLFLTYPDGDFTAESICSEKDGYVKSAGILIAYERILEKRRAEGKSNKLDGVEFV